MLRRLPSIQRRAQCIFCSIGHGQAAETPQCSSSSTRRLCFTTACLCAFVLFSQSHDQLFATPWAAACQASLSLTLSRSLPKFMSIESEMPSSHLILCHPFLLPPSIFPSIRVFSSESVLHIRWPKYWSFSFRISPSNEFHVSDGQRICSGSCMKIIIKYGWRCLFQCLIMKYWKPLTCSSREG